MQKIGIYVGAFLLLCVLGHWIYFYGFSYHSSGTNKQLLEPGTPELLKEKRTAQYYRLPAFMDLLAKVQQQQELSDGTDLFHFELDTLDSDSIRLIIVPRTNMPRYADVFAGGTKDELPPKGLYRLPVKDSLVKLDNTLLFKIIENGLKE